MKAAAGRLAIGSLGLVLWLGWIAGTGWVWLQALLTVVGLLAAGWWILEDRASAERDRPGARLGRRVGTTGRGWLVGFAVGVSGGLAGMLLTSWAVVLGLAIGAGLGLGRPRLAGPAGTLLGLGASWSFLLANAVMMCATSDPPQCGWAMFPGSLWLRPAAEWQTAPTDTSFATVLALLVSGLVLLIAGVLVSFRVAWRARAQAGVPLGQPH